MKTVKEVTSTMARDYQSELGVHQNVKELDAFCDLLIQRGVKSYLEIGSKWGGSLWRVGGALPTGSTLVSIDKPRGTILWQETEASLRACAAELQERGQRVTIIWQDSTSREAIDLAAAYGPYDAILIDANHTMPYLKKDWANYGPMGKLVAFHDISWKRPREWNGVRIDVPEFWNQLKLAYQYAEFKFEPHQKDNGIGVLLRE